jgi:hypothetical protein
MIFQNNDTKPKRVSRGPRKERAFARIVDRDSQTLAEELRFKVNCRKREISRVWEPTSAKRARFQVYIVGGRLRIRGARLPGAGFARRWRQALRPK